MKITIQINNEPFEVTLTAENLAQIEAQKESKHFEWNYGSTAYTVHQYGYSINSIKQDGIEHGRYRKTKEAAEQSFLRNKRSNRLEALVEQLGGLKEFVSNQPNYYAAKVDDSWKEYYSTCIFEPEKIYMTRECAIEICRMLNEGEFSLDGELG